MREAGSTRWFDIPLGRWPESEVPTWGAFARRYDRCLGRISSYVGRRVPDRGSFERIVSETLERNLELLVVERDELEELRRLRATADRLIGRSRGA